MRIVGWSSTSDHDRALLRRVVEAVNRVRAGDSVGTIRRGIGWCEGGSANATMTEKGWRIAHEGGDCRSWMALSHQWDEFISSWPVVYSPEENA